MADDLSSIPHRVNVLEREAHTMNHRINEIEQASREIPHRMTKVEIACERLPAIDERLGKLEDQVAAGFNRILGAMGVGGVVFSIVVTFGPAIIKLIKG